MNFPALLKWIINSKSFWWNSLGLLCGVCCHLQIMLSYSFPVCVLFNLLSCFIALTTVSSTMLSRSGDSGHPCLAPKLKANAFNYSWFNVMLVVDLSQITFIIFRYDSSIPVFFRILANGVLIFVKSLFCIYWHECVVLDLASVFVIYLTYSFTYVEPSCHLFHPR